MLHLFYRHQESLGNGADDIARLLSDIVLEFGTEPFINKDCYKEIARVLRADVKIMMEFSEYPGELREKPDIYTHWSNLIKYISDHIPIFCEAANAYERSLETK